MERNFQKFFQNKKNEVITEVNFLSKGSTLKGDCSFENFTRIHGNIKGRIQGLPGSLIVIGEEARIEGEIHCESLIIDGLVEGNIIATDRVQISGSGTLIGDVRSKGLEIHFGATFEGKTIASHADHTNPPHHKVPAPSSTREQSPAHS